MALHDRFYTRAVIHHLELYISTDDGHRLDLAGFVVTLSTNQRLTLNRVAQYLANKPDAYLDGMVRAMAMTNNIIPFNMRSKVRLIRSARA